MKSTPQTHFAKLVQEFFLDRLIRQRNSSPQTVAAYRDCFRLLFEFARGTPEQADGPFGPRRSRCSSCTGVLGSSRESPEKLHSQPERSISGAPLLLAFCRYQGPAVVGHYPTRARHSDEASQQAFGRIPVARRSASDNQRSRSFHATGQRDQALLATLYNTGARVSEAINIKIADLALGASPSIRLHGKGRKDRAVPIWPATALRLRRWLMQIERARITPCFPRHRVARCRGQRNRPSPTGCARRQRQVRESYP